MMEIKEKEAYNELYDCYNQLLTTKQREYYEMYYFNDFSLGEIADSLQISRNAVFDQIKKTIKILEEYESSLQLLKKKKTRLALIDEYEKKYQIDLSELKKND